MTSIANAAVAAAQFGEQVTTSLQELFKYSIISKVQTGDRTLDNLLTAFLLILSARFFAVVKLDFLKVGYRRFKNRFRKPKVGVVEEEIVIPNGENYKYWPKDPVMCRVRVHRDEEHLRNRLVSFLSTNFSFLFDKTTISVDETGAIIPSTRSHNNTTDFFTSSKEKTFPMFIINNDKFVWFELDEVLYLSYSDNKTLEKFIAYIFKHHTSTKEKDNAKLRIMSNGDEIGRIHPDRTFDNYISRHKKTILSALDRFIAINKQTENFNPFGNYNLGIIIHGKPGCGKTMLIKAICNYLKRKVDIVNMRKIKTRKDFEDIFINYEDYVCAFEELDCVQGVMTREKVEGVEEIDQKQNHDKHLSDLREEYMKCVAQLATPNDQVKEEMNKRIKDINKEIEDIKNVLTLDTILTTFDGINEMRGRVIIATTNHIDRIDPALLREGRFDLRLNLCEFDSDETYELLKIMFKGHPDIDYLEGKKFKSGEYTPVQIVNMRIKYGTLKELADHLTA